jgi:U3 small nucleolar RNA-associated protein 21
VIDIVTRKVVRQLDGHDEQLTDMAFSQDGRWIITSALDSSLKVWDVPSGQCRVSFVIFYCLLLFIG